MRRVYIVIRCDRPRCPSSVSAATQHAAGELATRTGWRLDPTDGLEGDLCPTHAKEATDA